MKIAYTGHRLVHDGDLILLGDRAHADVRDPDIEECFFGGAVGVDSFMLQYIYNLRGDLKGTDARRPLLTVVCPDTVEVLASWAKTVAKKYADRLIQLQNPITAKNGFRSFDLRNQYLVDRIKDCGQLTAFWSGRPSGTANAVAYAKSVGAMWEWVKIR